MSVYFIKKCPECGSTNLTSDSERGEIICNDCGLVIEEKLIDFGKEWREFDSEGESERRRTGSALTYTRYDRGLSTEIGSKKDIYSLSKKEQSKFMRLRKWQQRINTAIERNLKFALAELKRVVSYLNLPPTIEEEAARIYTMAVQKNLVRGRSMESVVAGAIYAACRIHDMPRTLDEIAEATKINKKEIGRTYRFITRELGIQILPSNPVDYMSRFVSALGLSPKVHSRAIKIVSEVQKKELTSGRCPTGIAAAALYIATILEGEKRTQREVAEVAGVTEVTIRNRYKEIVEKLKLDKELSKKLKKEEDSKKKKKVTKTV